MRITGARVAGGERPGWYGRFSHAWSPERHGPVKSCSNDEFSYWG